MSIYSDKYTKNWKKKYKKQGKTGSYYDTYGNKLANNRKKGVTGFVDGKGYAKKAYNAKKVKAENLAIARKKAIPQTERSFLDRAFGMLGYNGIAQGAYNVLDNDKRTTFLGGLKDGFKYMNPLTNDVTKRKDFGDVLKVGFGKIDDWQDRRWQEDYPEAYEKSKEYSKHHPEFQANYRKFEKFGLGLGGFAGDVLTDPITYAGGAGFKVAGKFLKGSGYTVGEVKKISNKLNINGGVNRSLNVAKKLRSKEELNDMVAKGVTKENIINLQKELGFADRVKPETLNAIAEDTVNTLHRRVRHAKVGTVEHMKSTVGLNNADFATKRATSLKNKINGVTNKVGNRLTEYGDKSLSPYYNSMTSKLRTNRLMRLVSTSSEAEHAFRYGDKQAQMNVLNSLFTGRMKAEIDNLDYSIADDINKFMSNLNESERLDVIQSLEDGTFKNAKDSYRVKAELAKKGSQLGDVSTPDLKDKAIKLSQQYKTTGEELKRTSNIKVDAHKLINSTADEYENYIKHLTPDELNTTAGRMLYHSFFKEVPDLATDDKKLMPVIKMLTSKKYWNLDLNKTVFKYLDDMAKQGDDKASVLLKSMQSPTSNLEHIVARTLSDVDPAKLDDIVSKYGVKYNANTRIDDINNMRNGVLGKSAIKRLSKDEDTVHRAYEKLVGSVNEYKELKKLNANQGIDIVDELREAELELANKIDNFYNTSNMLGRNIPVEEMASQLPKEIKEGLVDLLMKSDDGFDLFDNTFKVDNFYERVNKMREDARKANMELGAEYDNAKEAFKLFKTQPEYQYLLEVEKLIHKGDSKLSYELMSGIDGEHVDKIFKKLDDMERSGQYFADKQDKFEFLENFSKQMYNAGRREVNVNGLAKGQLLSNTDTYVPHILTKEAEDALNAGKELEKNGSFKSIFGSGGKFNTSRISDETIKEANMRSLEENGYKMFEDDLSKIYLNRMLNSNQMVYGKESLKFINRHFREDIDVGNLIDDIERHKLKGNVIGMDYHAIESGINKYVRKAIEADEREQIANFKPENSPLDVIDTSEVNIDSVKQRLSNITGKMEELKHANYLTESLPDEPELIELKNTFVSVKNDIEKRNEEIYSIIDNIKIDSVDAVKTNDKNRIKILNEEYEKYKNMLSDNNHELKVVREDYHKSAMEVSPKLKKISEYADEFKSLKETYSNEYEALQGIKDKKVGVHKLEAELKKTRQERFDKLKDKIVSEVFSDEKRKALYAPNVPIQELTESEFSNISKYINGAKLGAYNKEVADNVNILSKTQKSANMNALLKTYDKFLHLYKLANTLPFPSFHVQNIMSNAFQTYLSLSGSALNLNQLRTAHNILKLNDPKQVIKLGGKDYTFRELNNYAKNLGVINEGFINYDVAGKDLDSIFNDGILETTLLTPASFLKKTKDSFKEHPVNSLNPFSENNVVYKFGGEVGGRIETTQRLNLFMSALDNGHTLEDSARLVDDYLFNYSDLTKFEENVLKRAIPFYTYMRKNIPMELKAMLETPEKFSKFEYMQRELENTDDNAVGENHRNRWKQDYWNIPTPIADDIQDFFGLEHKSMGFDMKLPYEQLNRLDPMPMENGLFKGEPRALSMLLGSTSPLIKIPLELGTGVYRYTDIPIRGSKLDYLLNQTIPTQVFRDGTYFANQSKDEYGKLKENKELAFKDATAGLFFPVSNMDNVANYKTNKVSFINEDGNKVEYYSHYDQKTSDDMFKEVYGAREDQYNANVDQYNKWVDKYNADPKNKKYAKKYNWDDFPRQHKKYFKETLEDLKEKNKVDGKLLNEVVYNNGGDVERIVKQLGYINTAKNDYKLSDDDMRVANLIEKVSNGHKPTKEESKAIRKLIKKYKSPKEIKNEKYEKNKYVEDTILSSYFGR